MPTEKDIGKAYRDYYTHENENSRKPEKHRSAFKQLKRAFYLACDTGYFALRYEAANGASALEKLAGLLIYLFPMRRVQLDFNAMYLRVRSGARLLEIGCGGGQQLEFLRNLGWLAEGLDLDPVAVEVASARGLKARVGTLKEQSFPNRHFDAVVSSHVIEHVHDPIGLLRECGRILTPDGKLVVITPNTASWGHLWFRSNWLALDPPRHLYLFNPVALRRAAEEAGLTVLHVTSTVRDADGLFRASRDIQKTQHHVWGNRHSWVIRRWSNILQLAEWMLLQVGLDRGEELMMICERGGEDMQHLCR
ncbi:MAG: class I SAM-dependent methyltransferase [Nitrosospira sp.]|nr:class I SAM-dependent methyltransferase [Nitrosospira sp.]